MRTSFNLDNNLDLMPSYFVPEKDGIFELDNNFNIMPSKFPNKHIVSSFEVDENGDLMPRDENILNVVEYNALCYSTIPIDFSNIQFQNLPDTLIYDDTKKNLVGFTQSMDPITLSVIDFNNNVISFKISIVPSFEKYRVIKNKW